MTQALIPKQTLAQQYSQLLEPEIDRARRPLLVLLALMAHVLIFGLPLPAQPAIQTVSEKTPLVVHIPVMPLPPTLAEPARPKPPTEARPLLVPMAEPEVEEVKPLLDEGAMVREPGLFIDEALEFDRDDDVVAQMGAAGSRGAILIHQVDPSFPRALVGSFTEAWVEILITVGKDGRVEEVAYLKGHPAFRAAVLKAVMQWRFEPALSQGRPVRTDMAQAFVFRVE